MNFRYSQTVIYFPMQSLTDLPMEFPDDMEGNWRVTLIAQFEDGKKECRRARFDLVHS
jgi:hypothetical protein